MVRLDGRDIWLCVPLRTVLKLFQDCGLLCDWEQVGFRTMGTFYSARQSPYVYLVLTPRSKESLPKDAISGAWRHAILKPDGRAVFDVRNSLDFRVNGLHALRQFEPGDRIATEVASDSNVLRFRMPRRPVQRWSWAGEEDLW